MNVYLPLKLDLLWPNNEVIFSKTGDENRYAQPTLEAGQEAWNIPAGAVCTIHTKQINQNVVTLSDYTFTDNVLTIKLPKYTTPGRAKTEVEISVGGETVTSFDFTVVVLQSA